MVMRGTVLLSVLIVVVCRCRSDKPAGDGAGAAGRCNVRQEDVHALLRPVTALTLGDGPAAVILKTTPPDLTTLAKRHGGNFVRVRLRRAAFWHAFAAHGSSRCQYGGQSLALWTIMTKLPCESGSRISAST
jgi:hypothetical protein